ncbi:MAG: hypothetical protein SGILL_003487 [Bacillariaceae sp.]
MMRPRWFQASILFHFLSHGVVEPRIRQANPAITITNGSSLPVEFPRLVRKRRKSNLELIPVQSNGDGGTAPHVGMMQEDGVQQQQRPKPERHPQQLNLEGLNQAVQQNQMQTLAESPKLDELMKDRHEKPSLVSQINEKNKKLQMLVFDEPEAILRAFSMSMEESAMLRQFSMSMADPREADVTYDMLQRQFSMSMRMRNFEGDFKSLWQEEEDFFMRQGTLSMSMESRTTDVLTESSRGIPIRPRGIQTFQMQDAMSMPSAPSAPSMPSVPAPAVPTTPSMPSTGSPVSLAPGTTISPGVPSAPSTAPDAGRAPTTTTPPPTPFTMPDRTLNPTEASTDSGAVSRNGASVAMQAGLSMATLGLVVVMAW